MPSNRRGGTDPHMSTIEGTARDGQCDISPVPVWSPKRLDQLRNTDRYDGRGQEVTLAEGTVREAATHSPRNAQAEIARQGGRIGIKIKRALLY